MSQPGGGFCCFTSRLRHEGIDAARTVIQGCRLRAQVVIMDIEKSVVDALIDRPSENLAVEIKRWIDPTTTLGVEKIVKGALALRNRNGGYLVIGFEDKTLLPDAQNELPNAKELFHPDAIQAIISRFASDTFEIGVAWGARDGRDYPVIVIPPGVKIPVVAKRDLMDGTRFAIKEGAVYVRTLHTNGTISSAEARPRDWPEIMEICFDNREADVGRFVRRHLAGIDLASLVSFIGQQATPPQSLRDRAVKVIDDGEVKFIEAVAARTLSADETKLIDAGFWSVGLVIDPPHADAMPDQNFGQIIGASNPQLTGWPVWLDARTLSDEENRPKVKGNSLEYLIVSISNLASNHADFARLDAVGEFFLHRNFQDDGVPSRVTPGTALDPVILILRVAEAMAVGIAFAKALGWTPEETKLGFAFRFHQLSGRRLTAWSRPFNFPDFGMAHDDQITTFTEFSLDTPLSALPQFVEEATTRLFVAFDGAQIPRSTIEDLVKRLIERRLDF
jgi:hypothetical protein